MTDTTSNDCESLVNLPMGWKHKKIDGFGGKRSNKIVYFESPSGFLYRSPLSVLSHMRSSGLYSGEQVEQFEQQVAVFEERKNSKGLGSVKRKAVSERNDKTELNDNEPKKVKTTDFRRVLSEISDTPPIKTENELQINRPDELKINNKLKIPRSAKPANSSNDSKDKIEQPNHNYNELKVKTESVRLEDINSRLKNKNYVEVFDDKFVPAGWRVVDLPHYMPQNDGIPITKRRYVSPKGLLYSRSMACGALEKQNDQLNFEIMKNGLLSEGWIKNDQIPIPDRFYFQRREVGKGVSFITPEWKIIKGMTKYKEYLVKNSYDKRYIEDIKLLSMWKNDVGGKKEKDMSEETKEFEANSSTDISLHMVDRNVNFGNDANTRDSLSDDESFPVGWKVCSSGDNILVTSPTGRKFNSRRQALEFMLRNGEDADDLVKVWKTLSQEGWQEGDLLPSGWRVSTTSGVTTFLTRDMKVLTEPNEVIQYIKSDKSYSDNDLKKFVQWTKRSQLPDSSTLESWTSKSNLPEGWKTTKSHPSKFLCATGRIFLDKISALDYLISEHYNPEEIYKLWSTLDEDGWIVDRNLPTGWRRKTENSAHAFLSPMMQVFKSRNELSDYILLSTEFTPDEISKLKQICCDLKK